MKNFIKVLLAISIACSSGAYAMDADLERALRESAQAGDSRKTVEDLSRRVRADVQNMCAGVENRVGESLTEYFLRIASVNKEKLREDVSQAIKAPHKGSQGDVVAFARRTRAGHVILQLPGVTQSKNYGCGVATMAIGRVFDRFGKGQLKAVEVVSQMCSKDRMERAYEAVRNELVNRFYDKYECEERDAAEELVDTSLSIDQFFANGEQTQNCISSVDDRTNDYRLSTVPLQVPHVFIFQVKSKAVAGREYEDLMGHFVPFFIERLSDGTLGIVFVNPTMYSTDGLVDGVEDFYEKRSWVIKALINHLAQAAGIGAGNAITPIASGTMDELIRRFGVAGAAQAGGAGGTANNNGLTTDDLADDDDDAIVNVVPASGGAGAQPRDHGKGKEAEQLSLYEELQLLAAQFADKGVDRDAAAAEREAADQAGVNEAERLIEQLAREAGMTVEQFKFLQQ